MNYRVLFALLCTLVFCGGNLVHAADLSPNAIVELARALRSKNISPSQRQEGLKTLRESYEKLSRLSFRQAQKYSKTDIAQAQFEIEQLEVFLTLEKCKSNRNLSQSIAEGSSGYNPCKEGQQEPYEPGNKNLWDLNRTIKQVNGINPELVEKDLFRKRIYHRAVTNAVKNLIVLEIGESEVRWTSDQIQNRVSVIVKENCRNCKVLDTRLISGHVTKSVMTDQKSGAIKPQSLLAQTENVCTLLRKNNYDFYPVSIRSSAAAYISPIGQGRNDINVHMKKQIEALRNTVQSGQEALLILTHAMTDLSGGELAHVKLKCLKVDHKLKADQAHNISVMKSAYAEAESNVKKFLAMLKKDLHMKDLVKTEIDDDIEMLTKLAPRAIGEALYEQSDQASAICQVIQKIQKDDEFDETLDEIKIWGSVVVGTGLMFTGVFAPAGATVMGASLSMSALVTGVGINVGVGLHDAYMSSVVKEDSELLRAAAFASGNDLHLYRVSQEEWSRFESLRVSAILNLGLSAADVASLAAPLLKSGKGFRAVNQTLEKTLAEKTIATKEVKAAVPESKVVTQETKLQEAAWSAKEKGDLVEFKKLDSEVKERLATEKVKSIELLTGKAKRSTTSYQVELESGIKGIFKPDALDNPTRYELVVSEVDELLGFGVIPKKVERTIKGTRGSMQYWVEGVSEYSPLEYKKLINRGKSAKDDRIALLDYLFQNADAGPHNILIKENGGQLGIEHEMLYFKGKPGGREFFADDIPGILKNQEVSKALRELDLSKFEATLSQRLTPEETASVMKRVKALKEKVVEAKGKLTESFTIDESVQSSLLPIERKLVEENKLQEAARLALSRGDKESYVKLIDETEKKLKNEKIISKKRRLGEEDGHHERYDIVFENKMRGFFKPENSENLTRYEVAYSKMDEFFEFGVAPKTVERVVDGKKGAMQYFVQNGTHYTDENVASINGHTVDDMFLDKRISFLDFISNNADRHVKNVLNGPHELQWSLDHGEFEKMFKPGVPDFSDKFFNYWSADINVSRALKNWDEVAFRKSMKDLLSESEVNEVIKRVDYVKVSLNNIREKGRLTASSQTVKTLSELETERLGVLIESKPISGVVKNGTSTLPNGNKVFLKKDAMYLQSSKYELAVYKVSDAINLNVVPLTARRSLESSIYTIQSIPENAVVSTRIAGINDQEIRFFEYIFGLTGRDSKSYLQTVDGKLLSLNNGNPNTGGFEFLKGEKEAWVSNPKIQKAFQDLTPENLRKLVGDLLDETQLRQIEHQRKMLKDVFEKSPESMQPIGNDIRLMKEDPYPGLGIEKTKKADLETIEQMNNLGIKYTELPRVQAKTESKLSADLRYSRDQMNKKYLGDHALHEEVLDLRRSTALYQVRASDLPTPGAASPQQLAFLHPEMAQTIDELERHGYKVVVDSSLPTSRIGAYHWGFNNVIALKPNSTWSTFQHEFQHFKFKRGMNALLDQIRDDLRMPRLKVDFHLAMFEANNSAEPYLRLREEHPVIGEMFKLHSETGLGQFAIDETLAVRRQTELLKKYGYNKYSAEYVKARTYALNHQIYELEETQKIVELTDLQKKTLAQASKEKRLLEVLEGRALNNLLASLKNMGPSAAGLASVMILIKKSTQEIIVMQGKDFAVLQVH
ncbi:MAG: hypothetical protein KA715_14455 [Xanthomonadaceae bacterium]|nr:hypothetical protein [Xanthomonadaceae bacterium]